MVFKYISSYKVILILSIAVVAGGFVLPNFCCRAGSAEASSFAEATEDKMEDKAQMPQDFDEAGAFAMGIIKELPDAMKESWQEAKEIWRKTWVKWWVEKIGPYLQQLWQKVKVLLDKQIERVRAILSGKYYDTMEQQGAVFRQELEKEKQEMIQELSKYTGPIREKFKQMFDFRSFWDNFIGKLEFSR